MCANMLASLHWTVSQCSGIYILHLSVPRKVNHAITVSTTTPIIYDHAEIFSVNLSIENLLLCDRE